MSGPSVEAKFVLQQPGHVPATGAGAGSEGVDVTPLPVQPEEIANLLRGLSTRAENPSDVSKDPNNPQKTTDGGLYIDGEKLLDSQEIPEEGNYDAKFKGTSRGDIFSGTNGADYMLGGDGPDQLSGQNDDDQLDGQGGNDFILGGRGNDEIFGGDGDDVIAGDIGNDWLVGGDGGDDLQGGWGEDIIFGGAGDDQIKGGEGSDQLSGDQGDDRLAGGAGDDKLTPGAGTDTVFGGAGDDEIYAWVEGDEGVTGGKNYIHGGEGNDTLIFAQDKEAYRIIYYDDEDAFVIYDGNDQYIVYSDVEEFRFSSETLNREQLKKQANDTLFVPDNVQIASGS